MTAFFNAQPCRTKSQNATIFCCSTVALKRIHILLRFSLGILVPLVAHSSHASPPVPPVLCAPSDAGCNASHLTPGGYKWNPGVYIRHKGPQIKFLASDYFDVIDEIEQIPNVKGLLVSVYWGNLESTKGNYTFEELTKLYDYLKARQLRLQVKVSVASGSGHSGPCERLVPSFLWPNGVANNLGGHKCSAKIWTPEVMGHYIDFMRGFGAAWDSASHLEAIISSETALSPPYADEHQYSARNLVTQLSRMLDSFETAFPTTNRAISFNFIGASSQELQIDLYRRMVATETALASPDTFPQVPDVEGNTQAPTQAMRIRTGAVGGIDYRFDSSERYKHPAIWDIQPSQMGGRRGNWTPAQLIQQAMMGNAVSHVNVTIKKWEDSPSTREPDCAGWLPPNGSIADCRVGFRDYIASGAANPPLKNTRCPTIYAKGCR